MQCREVAGGCRGVATDNDIDIADQVLRCRALCEHAGDQIGNGLTTFKNTYTDKIGHGIIGKYTIQS